MFFAFTGFGGAAAISLQGIRIFLRCLFTVGIWTDSVTAYTLIIAGS